MANKGKKASGRAKRAAPARKRSTTKAPTGKDKDVRKLVGNLVLPTGTSGGYGSAPWLLLAKAGFDDLWKAVSILEQIVHSNDNTNKGRPVLIDHASGRSAPPPPPTFP